MDIIYKRLTENELDAFIQMRMKQLREEGATEEIDLVPNLEDYYKRHMADGTFVSWIAMDGDKIIGTSGMSFVEKPPYFGCPSGRIGLLSSMFTKSFLHFMWYYVYCIRKFYDKSKTECGSGTSNSLEYA